MSLLIFTSFQLTYTVRNAVTPLSPLSSYSQAKNCYWASSSVPLAVLPNLNISYCHDVKEHSAPVRRFASKRQVSSVSSPPKYHFLCLQTPFTLPWCLLSPPAFILSVSFLIFRLLSHSLCPFLPSRRSLPPSLIRYLGVSAVFCGAAGLFG